MREFRFGSLVIAIWITFTGFAQAALPDEIEVFDDLSLTPRGRTGVSVHVNTTPSGRTVANFPSEVVNHHGTRLMVELARGLTDTLEVGLHIPTALDSKSGLRAPGLRPRVRWIPLQSGPEMPWFLGANAELSFIDRRFEESGQKFELRGITGFRASDWVLAANPGWTWALIHANGTQRPDFAFDWKAMHRMGEHFQLGIESFEHFGSMQHPLPRDQRERTIYLAADVDIGKWKINVGIGRGQTAASDPWTVKTVVQIPFF